MKKYKSMIAALLFALLVLPMLPPVEQVPLEEQTGYVEEVPETEGDSGEISPLEEIPVWDEDAF